MTHHNGKAPMKIKLKQIDLLNSSNIPQPNDRILNNKKMMGEYMRICTFLKDSNLLCQLDLSVIELYVECWNEVHTLQEKLIETQDYSQTTKSGEEKRSNLYTRFLDSERRLTKLISLLGFKPTGRTILQQSDIKKMKDTISSMLDKD